MGRVMEFEQGDRLYIIRNSDLTRRPTPRQVTDMLSEYKNESHGRVIEIDCSEPNKTNKKKSKAKAKPKPKEKVKKCPQCGNDLINKGYGYKVRGRVWCDDCYSDKETILIKKDLAKETKSFMDGFRKLYKGDMNMARAVTCSKCKKEGSSATTFKIKGKWFCEPCYRKLDPKKLKGEYEPSYVENYTQSKAEKYFEIMFKSFVIASIVIALIYYVPIWVVAIVTYVDSILFQGSLYYIMLATIVISLYQVFVNKEDDNLAKPTKSVYRSYGDE